MTQIGTSGKTASGTSTASGGGASGGQAASTDTEEVVTMTVSADCQTKVPGAGVTRIFTTTVYDKRDFSLQAASDLPSFASPTADPVFLPSSHSSFASYTTVGIN
jgi:hypothetical protein